MHFLHARRYVHAEVHDGAGGREHDRAYEDVLQIHPRKAGIEQLLGKGHRRAVDVHYASEEVGERKRGDDAEQRAREGGKALLVPPGDEIHDDAGKHRDGKKHDRRGMPSGEDERDEELPDDKATEDEAE